MLFFSWFSMANYFITFFILAESMQTIAHWIRVPALICEYIYLAFIIYCFLLSMGNRPQGNRVGYLVSMIVFALFMLIMMVFVVFLAYWGITHELESHDDVSILKDGVFVRIVISVISTYGVWLLASLLFVCMLMAVSVIFIPCHLHTHAQLDPWHMITSLFQYLLLSPSFINVINICTCTC